LPGGSVPAGGYVPDGTAGLAAAFPLGTVTLLDSPMRHNRSRNTSYLRFVDADRLPRTFRLNLGLPSAARPCGGWEHPASEVRGRTTGHLLSALALTYANTGDRALAAKGRYLVEVLAQCQELAATAGFNDGYLSAFPESFFDRLEAGQRLWAPYYMIHKFLAGLIDQHALAGDARALEVAARLGDWVDRRTARLPCARMQRVWRWSTAACRNRWRTCPGSPARRNTCGRRSGSTMPGSWIRWPPARTSSPGCTPTPPCRRSSPARGCGRRPAIPAIATSR